jgi:hypothetical protein
VTDSHSKRGDREIAGIETRWIEAQENLVLQSSDLSLATLQQMVLGNQIDISPKYQRRERWDTKRQSALIESFLLNIPVPPIYLSEEQIGVFSVIDGKQRLSALARFLNNDLHLQSLSSFKELEGLTYADLPSGVASGLAVRPLRTVTLLRQSDPALKYEVFARLNQNSEPLNPQELRNVLFRGRLNDLIFELSSAPFLHAQLKIRNEQSERYKQMEDVEAVLRFFTLREKWTAFSGDYRRSMDDFMATHKNADQHEVAELRRAFDRALARVEGLWGTHAFRRPEGNGWRDQYLAGLYDAQMIASDSLSDNEFALLSDEPQRVIAATRELFRNSQFENAVRQATNTPARVRLRVDEMTNCLKQLATVG